MSQYSIPPHRSTKIRVPTKKIGTVQTNRNGGRTDVIIRTDDLSIMNGFPGPAKYLPAGIHYIRQHKFDIKIDNYCMIRLLAEKHDIFLRAKEVEPILRRSPIIRKINRRLGKRKKSNN